MRKTIRLEKLAILALLLSSVVLAARAQTHFETQAQENWNAALPALLGAVVFFSLAALLADRWLGRALEIVDCPTAPHKIPPPVKTSLWREIRTVIRAHPVRAALLALAALLSIFVLTQLYGSTYLCDCGAIFWAWLGSIGLAIAVVMPRPHWPRRVSWSSHGWLIIAVGLIIFIALFLRVYNLGQIPPTLGGDEGSQGVEALKILRGDLRNPFVTSWLSVPTLSFFFNALTIQWLGNTALALRLPWALIGTATVLIMFALTRRLKGLALAVMTTALLAAYHYHIHFSRLGSNQIADAFFMAAAFLCLYRAYDQGGLINWALAGVVAGLAQYFYAGARFTTLMVGVTAVSFIVRDWPRFWQVQRRGLLILIGAFLITAAPMVQYAVRFPADYNGRLNAVGIYQSGWMELAKKVTGQTEVQLLIDQFKRAALSYNAYPDRTSWYGSNQPFFDGWWAVLFVLGLGYATLRPFDRRLFPMLIWWWGAIILGGMLTESPPSSQRLITSAPPAVFFVGLALWKIGQVIQRLWSGTIVKLALPALAAAVVVVLCALSFNRYFVKYTPQRTYGNWTAVAATGIAEYAAQHFDDSWHIVFLGAPYMYIGFGTIRYLQPDLNATDLVDPVTAPLNPQLFPPDKKLAFIVLPERAQELALIKQSYPGGQTDVVPSPVPGATTPLFTVYEIAPPGG